MKKILALIVAIQLACTALVSAQTYKGNGYQFIPTPYSQLILITPAVGLMRFCPDCTNNALCSSGGNGAIAVGTGTTWGCAQGAGGVGSGVGFPLGAFGSYEGNGSALNNTDIPNGTINGMLNPMALRVKVAGTTNTFANAGAKCDGVTDDDTAIQNTINAAGGGIGGFGAHNKVPGVVLPTGRACFHSRPLEIGFAGLDFGGPSGCGTTGGPGCALIQTYIGPAIIESAYNSNGLSSFVGPFAGTKAYSTTTNVGNGILDFNGAVNSANFNLPVAPMSSSGSGFSQWVYIPSYTTVGGSDIWGASLTEPALDFTAGGTHPSYSVSIDNTPEMKIEANYGGTGPTCTLSGATLPSANAWHFILVNTVSGTMTCYVDGVSKATVAASGVIVQNPFETWCGPGGLPLSFPCGSNTNASALAYLYGMDIEDQAFSSPTTVPSGPVSPDSATVFLFNNDLPADGVGHPWQQAYRGAVALGSPNIYLPWIYNSSGNSLVPAYSHIHDIDLCYNSSGCDGIVTTWAWQSEFDHLTGNPDYMGVESYEDYLSSTHDNTFFVNQNNPVCEEDWSASESAWQNNGCWSGALMYHSFAESSGPVIHEWGQDDSVLVYGTASNQSNLDFQFWFDDAEAGNSVHVYEHLMDQDYGSSWQNNEDYMRNNSSEFGINAGVSPVVISPAVHAVSSTGNIFHFINTPTNSALIMGAHYYDSTPSLTNNADYVVVPDGSISGGRAFKTYSFSTLPACGSNTNGLGPFFCKDCTSTGTCAGSGNGASALCINSVWQCTP